jgi:hypothetical protein
VHFQYWKRRVLSTLRGDSLVDHLSVPDIIVQANNEEHIAEKTNFLESFEVTQEDLDSKEALPEKSKHG